MSRIQFLITVAAIAAGIGQYTDQWAWALPAATAISLFVLGGGLRDMNVMFAGLVLGLALGAGFGVYEITIAAGLIWSKATMAVGVLFVHWLTLAFFGIIDDHLITLEIEPSAGFVRS